MTAMSRLLTELKQLNRENDPGFTLTASPDNLLQWTGILFGPADTPFHGGQFNITLTVPDSYPHTAPHVKFITPIFHPNIHSKTGAVCLDILNSAWTPAWTMATLCRAILLLMANPEPNSPLNCDAGNLLRYNDHRGYRSLAKMYTQLYATPASTAAAAVGGA